MRNLNNKKEEIEDGGELKINIETIGEEQIALDSPEEREFNTIIAGLKYHIKKGESNMFLGITVPEPNNPYDKNAVMVLNVDGLLLGYIPQNDLDNFQKWSGGKPIPCVGHYFPVGDSFHSDLRCIRPYSMEFIEKECKKYFEFIEGVINIYNSR